MGGGGEGWVHMRPQMHMPGALHSSHVSAVACAKLVDHIPYGIIRVVESVYTSEVNFNDRV